MNDYKAERLTIRNSDGSVSQPMSTSYADVFMKLAAYEDTGLEPDQIREANSVIASAFELCCRYSPETLLIRLKNILVAEAEGHLVILPCKVGDTVFRIAAGHVCGKKKSSYSGEYAIQEFGINKEYVTGNGIDMFAHMILDDGRPSTSYEIFASSNIGKTIFLTRAEAEAAIKGVCDDAANG